MINGDLRALLSRNVKKFRAFRKLSQADFAEKVDISVPFLSDIENGKKWVSPATLAKIADALGIHAYELLKPEAVIPDGAADMLEKYTADILDAFGEALNGIRASYVQQINIKNSAQGVLWINDEQPRP